jgi:hypothetical protein
MIKTTYNGSRGMVKILREEGRKATRGVVRYSLAQGCIAIPD